MRILCVLVTIACAGRIFGAELSISESRLPNSPAFSLLGINPTAVEYPSTPMELGATLATALKNSGSGSLGNIALEFSPFWWTKNSTMVSYDEYYYLSYLPPAAGGKGSYRSKPLSEQNIFKNFYQTLTFSLATAESEAIGTTNLSDGTALGFGFRTTLIKGRLSSKALESRLKLRELDTRISREMTLSPDGKTTLVPQGLYDELLKAEKEHAVNLEYLAGLQLEVAGGGTVDMREHSFDHGEFRRAGAWMNASYRSDAPGGLLEQFAVLGNARYFYTETISGQKTSSVDVGGRLSWISQNEKLPLTLSAEYVRRFNSGSVRDVDRLAIVATVKLSDRYSLYFSHGGNIERNVLSKDNNITFIGLNALLGKASTKAD